MIIRVDKCSKFGIKKQLTKSVQYLPKLFVNNRLVPRIKMGESFRYLGRYISIMTCLRRNINQKYTICLVTR